MAGEGDRLGGGEGADGEDDGDEGSGVLRLMVSRLGSAGVGVAGFGSSFTSGFTSASGSLEVEVRLNVGRPTGYLDPNPWVIEYLKPQPGPSWVIPTNDLDPCG